MDIKFANNASSRLALALAESDTIVRVVATTGEFFPQLVGNSDYFMITLTDTEGHREICKVVSMFGDTFTVERAQEGTTALEFPVDSIVENRLTAGSIERILNDVDATDTVPGRSRIATQEEVIAGTANNVVISALGGNYIGALPGFIQAYGGALHLGLYPINSRTQQPDFTWRVCDGDAGTPDLRDRFVLGSSIKHASGSYGGDTNIPQQLIFEVSTEETEVLKPKVTTSDSAEFELPIPHNHSVTASTSAEFFPPYCSLIYLMKVS